MFRNSSENLPKSIRKFDVDNFQIILVIFHSHGIENYRLFSFFSFIFLPQNSPDLFSTKFFPRLILIMHTQYRGKSVKYKLQDSLRIHRCNRTQFNKF